MPEIICEYHIARERVGKRLIEGEHLKKSISPDGVQVAVGQRSHVRRWLTDCRLFPEHVTEYIALS